MSFLVWRTDGPGRLDFRRLWIMLDGTDNGAIEGKRTVREV
jgi:hypothetical protein